MKEVTRTFSVSDTKMPIETTLPWEFTDKPVTAWGGLRLIKEMLMRMRFQALLRAPKAVRLSTIRFQCFALGSWVGRNARKKILRIGLSWKRRAWFEGLFARIQEFQTPWPIPI